MARRKQGKQSKMDLKQQARKRRKLLKALARRQKRLPRPSRQKRRKRWRAQARKQPSRLEKHITGRVNPRAKRRPKPRKNRRRVASQTRQQRARRHNIPSVFIAAYERRGCRPALATFGGHRPSLQIRLAQNDRKNLNFARSNLLRFVE